MKHHSSLSREEREKQRLKAAALFKKGVSQSEVARRFKVSAPSVFAWHKAYLQGGVSALKSKGRTGFQSTLTEDKRKLFKKAILRGPIANGYETNLWTLPRLAAVMKEEIGISFGETWIWKIVRELGFTPQKPQVKAKERNSAAIAKWKSKQLPGLKKMGRQTWVLPRV